MQKIVRIVRLSFHEDKVDDFLKIFEKSKIMIRRFDGNLFLELMQDADYTNVYYTHSQWTSLEALEEYRHSELFKNTWAETKKLFNDRPAAHSLISREIIEI